ncbi:MAG: hypothetical protein IPK54_07970 [Dokdonella sp.]|uniref:hypothetical protein n=1 Tax=Dokdonella sp. TaxID=2291710 RepID=UPI0025B8A727|nr:hypothetical protein [Dokdonella sp.]MBK8123476.1 hypothetical protein [Dokdonella sp.]
MSQGTSVVDRQPATGGLETQALRRAVRVSAPNCCGSASRQEPAHWAVARGLAACHRQHRASVAKRLVHMKSGARI